MNLHSENEEKNPKNVRLPKAKVCISNKGVLNCLSTSAGPNKRKMKKMVLGLVTYMSLMTSQEVLLVLQ